MRVLKIVFPGKKEDPARYRKVRETLIRINNRLYGQGDWRKWDMHRLVTWDVLEDWLDPPLESTILSTESVHRNAVPPPEDSPLELYLLLGDELWVPSEKVLKCLSVYEVRAWRRIGVC